jgi:hypothetical protein
LIIELFSIFFDNHVLLIQHQILLLSEESNFSLIKNKQNFLTKSFYARLLAVRNYTELTYSSSLKYLSSKEKFSLVSLLYHKNDLIKYYNFYVIKNKGMSFSFDFCMMYYSSFYYLIKFSFLPFLEMKSDESFLIFRPYNIKSDVILRMNNSLLKNFNKLWYLKLKIITTLNFISKLWLLKNFPLEKTFLIFFFEQKNYIFCKYFYLIIFSYLLTGLVGIRN